MKKNYYILFAVLTCTLLLSGCTKKQKRENVSLTLWTAAQEEEFTKDAIQEFIRIHKNEATFNIKVEVEEIEDVKTKLLDSSKQSADIFHFASDQYTDLKRADILAPVNYDKDMVIKESGGSSASIIKEISQYSSLYAYPATNSNGYFLYYNKKYYEENDVTSLDNILSIAAKNKKYFAMDWNSGWYLYSFFAGADKCVNISADTDGNYCDFNSTHGEYTGVDVVKAMLKIAGHPGFKNVDSGSLVSTMKKNKVIAVVNGTWNAQFFKELWGKDCGAVKLPTFTMKGNQVQLGSFAGYKYLGVNSQCKQKEWATKLARWLTTYKYQLLRYKTTGECPANTDAAASYKVQISAPIAALNQQSQYATMQNVLDSYWQPMEKFGKIIAAGNPEKQDLQTLLDETVTEIEAIPQS